MKFNLISIIIIILFINTALLGNESNPLNSPPEEAIDDFGKVFFSDSHITECAKLLDNLRNDALKNIFEGRESMKNKEYRPSVKTTSGILMVYTINHEAGSYFHHFSVSRPPYLSIAFGKALVGLASERFGFPDPTEIKMSSRHVFHVDWILSPDEHKSYANSKTPESPNPIRFLMVDAIVRSAPIELNKININYSTMEKESSKESSNNNLNKDTR
ncbi:MAG: hypothetical protein JW925_05585 [Syntrophaceae bacterium]|nr:hypothetical protein [Syntrophaceae bacterium]